MKHICNPPSNIRTPEGSRKSTPCGPLWAAGLILGILAPGPGAAFAQDDFNVPDAINYQGRLTDSEGAPVPAGYYDVEFRIWNDPLKKGEGDYLWGRVFSLGVASNGIFNVLLNDAGGLLTWPSDAKTSLLSAFNGSSRYLGLTIVSKLGVRVESSKEISPRQQLLSAPYAIHAQQATRANLATWADNSGTSTNTSRFGLHEPGEFLMATQALQTLVGDLSVNGKVGIGVPTPLYPLHFASTTGDKIILYGGSGTRYGFGIQDNLFQIYSSQAGNDIAFGYGTSTSFTERMRVRGSGNVGIGTNGPEAKLHVRGTTMLDLGASGGGALMVANNANDNSIYLEGWSSNHTGHAKAIHITGLYAQPLPTFNVSADAVRVKDLAPIIIQRYTNLVDTYDHPNNNTGIPTNTYSAVIAGFRADGDFSGAYGTMLRLCAVPSTNGNWSIYFHVHHTDKFEYQSVDVMFIRRELVDDRRKK